MNTNVPLNACDQRVLDLLVDGELTPEQERTVLMRLEQCPDGWRRCALAFIEQRVWKEQVRELPGLAPSSQRAGASSAAGSWHNHWTWALAMAAAFLLAVGLGQMLPPWWGTSKPARLDSVAKQQTPAPTTMLADTQDQLPHTNATAQTTGPAKPVGNLTLVDDSGKQVKVPIFDWNRNTANRLLFQSEPLPSELVTHLKRHEVRRRQRFVPVQLKDGRRVLVPVQELDFVPVPGTAY